MIDEPADSSAPSTPPVSEERLIRNARDFLTPSSSNLNNNSNTLNTDRPEEQVDSPNNSPPTTVGMTTDAEDLDLSHLLSDLDDILTVQVSDEEFLHRNQSTEQTDTDYEDDNISTGTRQPTVDGPQSGSMPSVQSVPSDEDGIKPLSSNNQQRLQEYHSTPNPTVATESSTTTSSPHENGGREGTTPTSPAAIMEKENLLRELEDLRMDRDYLEQQLVETRNELDTARTSLQKNIYDLEHELRSIRENTQRLNESRENEALEMELFELAQMAREQEEKELAAKKNAEQRALQQSSFSTRKPNVAIGKTGLDTKNDSEPKLNPNSASCNDGTVSHGHSNQFYQDKIKSLEEMLSKREFREQLLEKEIRDLQRKAQVESQKFRETQRQVAWFQEELLAMNEDQEDDNGNSDNDGGSKEPLGIIPEDDDTSEDDDTNGLSREDTRISDSKRESPSRESKRIRLLQQQRLDLEHRVTDLLDEVGTLKVEQGQLQHEHRQQDSLLQQLRQEMKQQKEQYRMGDMLLQRQVKEWQERADSLQKQLKREQNASQELRHARRKEGLLWRRQVEELEKRIKDFEDTMEREKEKMWHERRLHEQVVTDLESRLGTLRSSASCSSSERHKVDRAEDANIGTSTTVCSDEGCIPSPPSVSLLLKDAEDEIQKLKHQIHQIEGELSQSRHSESRLLFQLTKMEKQLEATQGEIGKLTERVTVLQTFLDISLNGSPSRQKSMREEYASYLEASPIAPYNPSSNRGRDDKNLQKSRKISSESRPRHVKIKDQDVSSECSSVLSCTGASICSLSRSELSQQSILQDMQLKLDHELVKLKVRKDKLRRNSASSQNMGDSVRKYRSLLVSCADGNSLNSHDERAANEERSTPKEETSLAFCFDSKIVKRGFASSSKSSQGDSISRHLANDNDDSALKLKALELEKEALEVVLANTEEKITSLAKAKADYEKREMEWEKEQQHLHETISSLNLQIMIDEENKTRSLLQADLKESQCKLLAEKETIESELASLRERYSDLETHSSSDATKIKDMEQQLDDAANQRMIHKGIVTALQSASLEKEQKLLHLENQISNLKKSSNNLEEQNIQLQAQIEELKKILSNTNDQLTTVTIASKEQLENNQQRLKDLEAEVTALNNELSSMSDERLKISLELQQSQASVEDSRRHVEELQTEINALQASKENLEGLICKKDQEINSIEGELSQSIDELNNLKTVLQSKDVDINRLADEDLSVTIMSKGQLENNQQRLKDLEAEVTALNNELSSMSDERLKISLELQQSQASVEDNRRHVEELQTEINALQASKENLEGLICKKDQEINSIEGELSQSIDELNNLKNVLQSKDVDINRLADEDLSVTIMSKGQLENNQRRLKDLEAEVTALNNELSSMSDERLKISLELQQSQASVEDSRRHVEELQTEINALQASKENLEGLICKKDQEINSIEGELSQSIDELNNLKTVLQSKDVDINRLADEDLSVTIMSKGQLEYNQQRLKDLEAEVTALNNELSSMSDERLKISLELQQSQASVEDSRRHVEELQTEINALQASKENLEGLICKKDQEINSIEGELSQSIDELNNLKNVLQSKDVDINKLADEDLSVTIMSKGQLENNQQRLKDLEAKVTALNNELSSMSDERLKISLELQQSQASVEDSRRHVEELQTEINALQASKENLEGLICKKDQEINSIEGELSQSIDELNNLKTVLQSKDVDINRLADEDLSVTIMSKGQLEYNQQRLKDLEAEVTALNNELSSMSDERLKISLELQQSQASVEDSRRHVEELQTEINALQASKENLEGLICKKDQEINSIEGELSQSIDELNNLKTVLQSKDVDINRLADEDLSVTIMSKGQLEYNQQRLKDLEAEVTALNNELSSMSDERLKISLELQQSQASVEDSRRHVEELQTEINALQASKENLEGLICKKDQEINSIEGELSQSIDESNNLKTVLQSKDADINILEEEGLVHEEFSSRNLFLEAEVLERDSRLSQVVTQLEQVTTDLSMKHVAISSFEEKSRTQDLEMAELSLRLSRMTEEMANRSADADRECTDLKKILKEVEERLLEETTLRKKLSSQIELGEMRLSETSNHLLDMEMLLHERTEEVETLKLQIHEMELEAEKKDSLIEKKEERLIQASQALSEIEESLHEKENQIHFQEQRLLQASTALSEMEEILEEKECQGKIQDENLMHASLQVATMTEDLSAKEAEMKQKLQQQDTRLVEAASQLGELEKLVLSMTSDVEDRDIKMKALEAVVQRLEAELEQLNAEVEAERTVKNRLSADLVEIQHCLSQKETQLDKQLKTVAKLTSQGDFWQLELDDLEGANQILVSKLQAIEEENKRLKHYESDVEVLTKQIIVLKDENSKAAELLAKVQEEGEALSNQLIVGKDESSVLLKAIEEQEQRKAAVLQEEAGSEFRLLQECYTDPCQTLQREGVLHSIDTARQEDCSAAASLADVERVALSAEIKERNEKLDSAKMLAQNRLEELQESSSKFCEERKILAVEVERAKEVLDIHKSKALALETMINELQSKNEFLTNELAAAKSGKDQRSSVLEKRIADEGSLSMGEMEVLDHLDELQKVKCQCDQERRSLSMKIQALTEENAGITSKVETLEIRESTLAFEYRELQEKYHELEGEIERCTAKADEESKLLTVKMEASLEALGIASSELETYKERNANLQVAYAELQQQNAELCKKNVVLTDNECSFEAKIDQLQYDNRKTVEGLQTKITALESQKDAITESLNILREEFNNEKSSWQDERYKLNSMQEALQQKMVEAESEFNYQMVHLRDQAGGLQKDFIEVIAERDELLSMMQAIQDESKAAMEEVETTKGRFLRLENEKGSLASELNQLIDVHRALAAQRLKELSDIEKEKEALIDEKQSLQDENSRLSGELHAINLQAALAAQRLKELSDIEKEKEALIDEKQYLQDENSRLSGELHAINLQAGTISKELHDLLDEHKSTVEALQEELSELRVQREILLAKVGSLEEKVGDLEEKFRNALKEKETLMEELVTVKSQAQEIEVEGEMLSRELSEFSEQYKALAAKKEHEIFVLKEERTRLVAQVKQLQDEFEELQQMAEDEEHDQKEFLASFQKEREELKRERDESVRLSETLRGEVQALKTQKKELESEITHFAAKIESQCVEIRHLNQSRDELASELEALEGKDMYRRELLSDLSTELNLTASREYKLQLENHELKERSICEEVTIESFGSRERSVSDEMDYLQKELDDAAVREAMLQCEIAETSGERDAFKEQQNPNGSDNQFETTQEEFLRLIKGEREALLCAQTDMKGQLSLSGEDTVSNIEQVGASTSKEGTSNGHVPFSDLKG
ncbi:chromosome segregation ATPase-like protein [Nitzschia inconspicua]|uniref:Chromosome segregation ATPase-like protein n=1 Tax=Nitzschia inconspicua TaxID=303405 RepID=A0A9K3PPA1_9STRA|nr:chromosome segregation ATPase-like protein [Nitzschia inconspicua]